MKTFEFRNEIWIPRTSDEIFDFFSDAANLDYLTPEWLHFRILTPRPIAMAEGTEIDYYLRLRGLPLRWRSRITRWDPPNFFVDEQVRGPYRSWIHEHHFRPTAGGTMVEDHVRYAVWGGVVANRFLVARDLARIFAYRNRRLVERFPAED